MCSLERTFPSSTMTYHYLRVWNEQFFAVLSYIIIVLFESMVLVGISCLDNFIIEDNQKYVL